MDRRIFIQSMGAAAVAAGSAGVAAAQASGRGIRLGTVRLVVTEPERRGRSAVVLLPTIAGIDGYMSRVAGSLTQAGHVVAIWDPYAGKPVPADTMGQLALSRAIRDDDAMRGIRTVVDHLAGPMKLASIATIGWCLGGRYALLYGGLDRRLAAVVSYNPTIYSPTPVMIQGAPLSKADFPGQTLEEFGAAQQIACPVQVARPGHDLAQPAEYEKLQRALYARAASTRIDYFPEAAHGFAYQPKSDADRAAATLAWSGTMSLLGATVG